MKEKQIMNIKKISSKILVVGGLLASPVLQAQDSPWRQIQLHSENYAVNVNYQVGSESLSEAGTDCLATPLWVNVYFPNGQNRNEKLTAVIVNLDDDFSVPKPFTLNPDLKQSSANVSAYAGQCMDTLQIGEIPISEGMVCSQNTPNELPQTQQLTITDQNGRSQVFIFKMMK
jgi:hypothetical protein